MDTRYNMIIIKGEIKTTEVMSCVYDTETHKWNVKFNNGKSYLYAYMNVEKLTKLDVLNPKLYRISREGREFFDIDAISVFRGRQESYWHICFKVSNKDRQIWIIQNVEIVQNTKFTREELKKIDQISRGNL